MDSSPSANRRALNYKYDYAFRQSPENRKCWKERLAWVFRHLANMLDGRETFALRFHSDPVISKKYRNECVERGMSLSFDLMLESVKYESMSQRLQEEMPHLWLPDEINSEKR